jgi:multisubunit Na+/H+ antiporter MnhF subunit
MAIHDFFFTSQAWALAHLWLVWVAVLRLVRRPERRKRIVAALAASIFTVVVVTWSMVLWLGGRGTLV